MKNINKTFNGILWVLLLIFCFTFGSCKKFIGVDEPDSQITKSVVFEDVATANAALANLYIQLRDKVLVTGQNIGLPHLLGLYTDEVNLGLSNDFYSPFLQDNLFPSTLNVNETWKNSYKLIYATNSILEGLAISTKISEQDKNRIQGEALFVRAYIHFYLLNVYGSIPYITTTDYRVNTKVGKLTSDAAYTAIINDLKEAKALVPDTYVSAERVRPNRSTVSAMLARVYLYIQDWTNAEIEASAVIGNNEVYKWVNDLDKVFLKESTGTIWQLMPNSSTSNTFEGKLYYVLPSATGAPQIFLNNELVKAFEDIDQRKTHWLRSGTNSSGIWYFPYKYKEKAMTSPTSKEYSILFRLEEQYLVRAEARAKKGNFLGAKEDLNMTRNRAGLGNTSAGTELELLDAILKERRLEFFTENGHRFFDLKRTGKIDATLTTAIKPGWDAKDKLWPLPQNELRLNPNLKPQNPGYIE